MQKVFLQKKYPRQASCFSKSAGRSEVHLDALCARPKFPLGWDCSKVCKATARVRAPQPVPSGRWLAKRCSVDNKGALGRRGRTSAGDGVKVVVQERSTTLQADFVSRQGCRLFSGKPAIQNDVASIFCGICFTPYTVKLLNVRLCPKRKTGRMALANLSSFRGASATSSGTSFWREICSSQRASTLDIGCLLLASSLERL